MLDIAIVVALVVITLRRGTAHSPWRLVAAAAGILTVVLATTAHLGGDPRHVFLAASIQFCLLFFLAPLLLALSRPSDRPTNTFLGLLGPVLACVVTLVWFLTPWLRLWLSHDLSYQVGHLLALGAGWLFCAPAVRAKGHESGAYPMLILVAFLELLLDAIPGILITVRKDILAPTVFLPHNTHLAAHTSQVHGGEVIWVIAELLDIPFLAALVFQWVRADARHAAVIDARLDAHGPAPDETNPGELQRPWWETDASVFGERARNFKAKD
jgi:cytochrome c oxidase assembly factor CtaG